MKLSSSHSVLVVVAVALCAVAAGCTGSEQIVSANGTVVVRVVGDPSSGGRYDLVTLSVESVIVRPEDPAAQDRLGGASFALFAGASPVVGSLLEGPSESVGSSLVAGSYRITGIVVGPPRLTDTGVPPGTSCLDTLQRIPGSFDVSPPFFTLGEADIDFSFDLTATGATIVNVVVDVPAMIAAYESAFTCSTIGCPNPTDEACLQGFDYFVFASQLPQFVDVR